MQERILRPKWINPFTRKSKGALQKPWFEGFLRAAPLHRWSLSHITRILELVSKEPDLFGLPQRPTCVINTSHMLPSARSRQSGITVFGTERGCKTVVVPPSCSRHPFDATDAKLMEPIFRWNPSVELLFLSKSCEPIAHLLAPQLKPLRHLTTLVLVDWEDPAAIHKVVMACTNLEMLDTVCPDEQPKNWQSAVAVESLSDMIEMHRKLKCLTATADFLGSFYHATEFSRCKHNVALVGKWCRASRFFRAVWITNTVLACLMIGCATSVALYRFEIRPDEKDWFRDFGPPIAGLVFAGLFVALDHFRFKHTGRGWTYWVRYLVLLRRRFGKPTVTYETKAPRPVPKALPATSAAAAPAAAQIAAPKS
jgi:hypothetical protein